MIAPRLPTHTILSSDFFQIDFFQAHSDQGKLLFTFSEYESHRLDGLGFGGAFALDNGFDLVAFKSAADDWYQGLPSNSFDLIEQFLATRHPSERPILLRSETLNFNRS